MADRAALEAMLADLPGVGVKGKATPYAALNGNMFAFLDPAGRICLRLGDADRADDAKDYDAAPVIGHGAVMKGYVALAEGIAAEAARAWAVRSHRHVPTLKPKPTRRAPKP